MPRPIRVVIVDDSALMREMLKDILTHEAGMEVAGVARDAFEAREVIKATNPDVITLDVEMPKMDGLSFLEKIMTLRPTPVIMVSSLTSEGSDAAIRALELGAVDCVAKPGGSDGQGFEATAMELVSKIRVAATARLTMRRPAAAHGVLPTPRRAGSGKRLIAIGASTGGVERIRDVLAAMPADCPPIVVTQHMGPSYVPSFAARLDRLSAPTVRVAAHGDRPAQGLVLIAPGDRHLAIIRDTAGFVCHIQDTPPVSGHRPSVDVLFASVAKAAGSNAVGVILSGMGRDGAIGMKAMQEAGAFTIGEQESSCVVYGMPRAAREAGAVAVELPLAQIPAEMLRAFDAVGERPRTAPT
ncbi:two-component system chemotaxis response regulator CheB [Azospirillum lipoferum]|uniref:Protein-glutamate methylesterase/protein-glutamine glutaminase n=1 Tax=Azospirillum lipoferum TaxID=193 RepID=A0A5A9GWM8_AZOLI|nr:MULTISPECIES: chemotaxis response regulator protein-glutamate methylesterase [Azospirillum]KAA0598105.1 chemotaxis response regulator protein-glutamate methylesterase [Azospirillum lipoferum]MCP1613773.1 two-component system chemotaxis response regulator CheB [Azospirillum lipoferum]MDW5534775.1 chemotaxis response regulator protein-glutamate methylesterase [Azospirillum sp. NL1]